ncbi:NucA/NucB deoxyribonuclease domain-containing protein [Nonomuraea endophytica]|uniref:Deoxyribonuclease NucA/NucB domain-containing protein n=1 Tax=Nonomuraea endophytica TaxID=714136 RepID=A0A7W8A9T3_9ACTN|nr:NucA/NucB deoxyribonuclease domain-containing protein [Nonomuraea endophytica]MBB5082291.1 hypothetical protein [Nonomuraea endophytica]
MINHIEKALSRETNLHTNLQFRPGDTTSNRFIEYPPHKNTTGTERPKDIPGNYRAAPNTTEGAALWRGTDDGYAKNRAIFSGHRFWMHRGFPEEFYMKESYGSNYCKYYNSDLYAIHGNGALRCDEYPFASTQEGTAKDKINYSVQAVFTSYNARHGEALQAFYSQYRLLTYGPVNTITKVSDSPFWVQIVE